MAEPMSFDAGSAGPPAPPGGSGTVTISLRNRGSFVDRHQVEVTGIPTAWYELEQASVVLFPGDSASVALVVHPPLDASTLAAAYPTTILVASEGDPTIGASAVVALTVSSVGSVTASVMPLIAERRAATFRLPHETRRMPGELSR